MARLALASLLASATLLGCRTATPGSDPPATSNVALASGAPSTAPPATSAGEARAGMTGRLRVNLPSTFDNGTFARYTLGADEVVVRRGREAGFAYGEPLARRTVTVQGVACEVRTYLRVVQPSPLRPGPPASESAPAEPAKNDVLFAAGEELLVPHREGVLERLVAALTIE